MAGVVLSALFSLMIASVPRSPADPYSGLVRLAIQVRLEAASPAEDLIVAGELVCPAAPVRRFYEKRGFLPAWRDPETGEAILAAQELLREIAASADHGLDPAEYHARVLLPGGDLSGRVVGIGAAADADLLLTDAFLLLASHLLEGRVEPRTFDPDCLTAGPEVDVVALLEAGLATGRIGESLAGLEPSHPGYRRLIAALDSLRALAVTGAWAAIEPGPTLEPGADDVFVSALRERLVASGELAAEAGVEQGTVYDEPLQAAVRSFQERHGLDPDGRVGARTRAALGVSAAERARQIELNLERWRWLPRDLGERFVLVNVAGFTLQVEERNEVVLRMRAAVGRTVRQTPVFSSVLRQVVLAPWWAVPRKLAVFDVLPKIREDPEYLSSHGFLVHRGPTQGSPLADPAAVDWRGLDYDNFPFLLRQAPGPLNPLGSVKFLFPNPFDVYLHDTPSRGVFERFDRDVSSGCVRLEKAMELAQYLLADDPRWTAASLAEAAATGREQSVAITRPLPIHIQYWTAWVEADGSLQFREDLYGRDERLASALDARRASRAAALSGVRHSS